LQMFSVPRTAPPMLPPLKEGGSGMLLPSPCPAGTQMPKPMEGGGGGGDKDTVVRPTRRRGACRDGGTRTHTKSSVSPPRRGVSGGVNPPHRPPPGPGAYLAPPRKPRVGAHGGGQPPPRGGSLWPPMSLCLGGAEPAGLPRGCGAERWSE